MDRYRLPFTHLFVASHVKRARMLASTAKKFFCLMRSSIPYAWTLDKPSKVSWKCENIGGFVELSSRLSFSICENVIRIVCFSRLKSTRVRPPVSSSRPPTDVRARYTNEKWQKWNKRACCVRFSSANISNVGFSMYQIRTGIVRISCNLASSAVRWGADSSLKAVATLTGSYMHRRVPWLHSYKTWHGQDLWST